MISLGQLKQALAPLESFGKDERTFDLHGTKITVRPLLPVEEVTVQRYATAVLDENRELSGVDEDGSLTRAAALDYFDRFRIEVLSYAVVQIAGLDLRGTKTISTGELLDDGTPVQVPKHVALRDLIRGSWSRPALTIAFAEYGELVQKLQDEADNIARKSIEDLDVEAKRLEDRLKEVRLEREKRVAGDSTVFKDQVDALLQADAEIERLTDTARAEVQAANAPRVPVTPPTAPPPGVTAPVSPPTAPPAPEDPNVAMRLPPQVVSGRGRGANGDGKPDLNPAPKGAANPNFRPARGN